MLLVAPGASAAAAPVNLTLSPAGVVAGASTGFTETFTTAASFSAGSVSVTVPASFGAPTSAAAQVGSCGAVGAVAVTGSGPWTVTISGITCATKKAFTLTYSSTAATAVGKYVFGPSTAKTSSTAAAKTVVSPSVTVGPAGAASFVFSGLPSATVAGATIGFTLTAVDAFGNTATGYLGTALLSSTSSSFLGSWRYHASDRGSHTFKSSLTRAGTETLTATDQSDATITGSSSPILVTPAAAKSLRVVGSNSASVGALYAVLVTALDPYGNTATGYTGTVHFTSSDTLATLPGDDAFTSADAGHNAYFARLRTVGVQSITVTDTHTNSITGTKSNITVAVTAPGAPTIGTATAGDAQATVTFTPPSSDGGSAITGYTVTSTPDAVTASGTASPITVTGLTNGTAYTFTVHATNNVGDSPESAASNSVTPERAPFTTLVSVSTAGTQGNSYSRKPDLSADGNMVAFVSDASNLGDTTDTTAGPDVFVHDVAAGTTERLSVAPDGSDADGFSDDAAISADGLHVVFWSRATNLVAGDNNGVDDVFVRDLLTGTTERVSVSSAGDEADGPSQLADISADGRYVAFASAATNLGGGTDGTRHVYVRDRTAGTTTLVSVAAGGGPANLQSDDPAISADGSKVAFTSVATDLVAGDTNDKQDVYLRDLGAGTTERISVSDSEAQADGTSFKPTISGDGNLVAFYTQAGNLATTDTNGTFDAFVRDRAAGSTVLVGRAAAGQTGDGESVFPTLSADGHFVAFTSSATNLQGSPSDPFRDVFLEDLSTGVIAQVSLTSDGLDPFRGSGEYGRNSLSGDGRVVGFDSLADDIVATDSNSQPDVFVRDQHPAP